VSKLSARLDGILDLSETELLFRLDQLVYGDQAMSGMGRHERELRAREWLERVVNRHRDALCAPLRNATKDWRDAASSLIELATVMDAMVSIGLNKPSATVGAAILMKWGLQKICFGNGDGRTA
jgi:hypothetical protein